MVKTFTYDVRYPSRSHVKVGLEFGFFDTLMLLSVLELFHLLQIDIS